MYTIIFKVSANSTIGLGHLSRSISLARELYKRKIRLIMIGPNPKYCSQSKKNLFHEWHEARKDNLAIINRKCKEYDSNFVVIDEYPNKDVINKLKNKGFRVLIFGQVNNENLKSNILISQTPSIYKKKTSKSACNILSGPNYAIIREEFKKYRKREVSKNIKKIFVCFGGGNDRGAIKQIFNLLNTRKKFINFEFQVVSGKSNPNNENLKRFIRKNKLKHVKLIIDPKNIAKVMKEADIAIISGGIILTEIAYLGIPPILYSIASNQHEHIQGWRNKANFKYLGPVGEISKNKLLKLNETFNLNYVQRKKLKKKLQSQIDGNGSIRIANFIEKYLKFNK